MSECATRSLSAACERVIRRESWACTSNDNGSSSIVLSSRGEEKQRLIALLHDLGKNLPGDSGLHAERSARFAEEMGLEPSIVDVIRVHDENWYALRRWRKSGNFDLATFVAGYDGVDLGLLVPFKYADNCDRELFPIFWMEHRLVGAGVYDEPYYVQNPAVIAENNVVRGATAPG